LPVARVPPDSDDRSSGAPEVVTTDSRQRVEEIFEAAVDLPRAERASYIDRQRDDDPLVLAEVRALLAAHDRAGGLLERPLPPAPPPSSSHAIQMGERIGSYRIVGELGRGGMGVVYAAERDDGQFRRRVAIKVLRADADPSLESRVIAERQILASLDHPHIARLLDGGITDDGRPFLVMEQVDGLPIDVYADRMRLTLDERLRLFCTVAEAVQHAHRNLVVHRDLKPSNILVTSRGDVKLLDFGIAKLLNPALGPAGAPHTLGDKRALTPEYASPEQIRGEPLNTASDVYSLGVVLYRLLAGVHPYDLENQSMQSVVEVISRKTPRKPSEAVAQLEASERDCVANDRRTTPDRLGRRLRGDLDAIVLRALRKEAADRYGSPERLAQDLSRHVDGQPVEARKGVRGYRFRSFLRRHRYGLVAVATIIVSLVGGAGAALWQAQVASEQRDRAEDALAQTEEIAAFLMSLFTVADPTDIQLDEITARDLLRRGLVRVEGLSSQPLVQARLMGVIADVHMQLGQYEDAIDLHRRSLAGRMAELGPEDPEVASAMNALGVSLRNVAGYDESRSLHQEALRIQRAALTPGDTALATTLGHLAYIEFDLHRRAELQRRMLELRTRALGSDHADVVDVLSSLANTERGLGHYEEAETLQRQALESAQRDLAPSDPRATLPMLHLGDILYGDLGRPDEAEALFRRAISIQERELGEYDLILIHGLHSLGDLLGEQGRHQEAERMLRRAIDILSRALGPEHPRTVGSNLGLAHELVLQGRGAEAEPLYQQTIAVWEESRGSGHPSVATARAGYALALEAMGRLDEAEAEARTALAIRRGALGERSIMAGLTLTSVGDILRRQGRVEEARNTYLEGHTILLEHLEPDHPQVRDIEVRLEALDLDPVQGPTTSGRSVQTAGG
jgi:serine/threonine protein kinase